MSTFPFNSFYYCCCFRENRRTWKQKAKIILFICYCKQRSEEEIWKLNTQFCLDLESLLLNSSDSCLSGQFTAGPWGLQKKSLSLYSVLFLWRAFSQISNFSITELCHHERFLSDSISSMTLKSLHRLRTCVQPGESACFLGVVRDKAGNRSKVMDHQCG